MWAHLINVKCTEGNKMRFTCSLITVEDINRSREFYEKLLQQKVNYDFDENIVFEGGFALHLKSHFQD